MTENKHRVLLSALFTTPLFKNLPEDVADALINAGTIKDYSKNQVLFLQGEPATSILCILSGWIKLSNMNSEGKESGIQMRTRRDTIGLYPLFNDRIHSLSAISVGESKVLAIPATALKDRSRRNPDLLERSLTVLAYNLEEREIAEACLALKMASKRTACLLLRFSSFMTGKGGTFKLPYEKSIAAAELGMDQATFSRALAALKNFGVAPVGNGEIHIEDFSTLAEHCCAHCPILEEHCKGRRLKPEKQDAKLRRQSKERRASNE